MQRARLRSRRAPTLHDRREAEATNPTGPYATITALQQSAGNHVTRAAIAGKGTPVATLDGPGASTKTYHFWEAWEVEAGKKVTVWQDKGLDKNDDEYYVPPAHTKKKGSNKVVGAVKFYEGALPADFKKNNPSTLAGILHSTTTQPPFWDGSGTAHNITATWDDTGAAKVSDVEAQAGATRLKGTP